MASRDLMWSWPHVIVTSYDRDLRWPQVIVTLGDLRGSWPHMTLTSHDLCDVTWPHMTSVTSHDLTWPHVTSHDLCYVMLRHMTLTSHDLALRWPQVLRKRGLCAGVRSFPTTLAVRAIFLNHYFLVSAAIFNCFRSPCSSSFHRPIVWTME